MNTLDWLPWHWKNWRLSKARERMHATERGIYRELLDICWADGSFEFDAKYLAKQCACSPAELRKAWKVVSRWFERRPDGRYFNQQMAVIFGKQRALADGRLKRAKKGGAATRKKWREGSKPASSHTASVQRELTNSLLATSGERESAPLALEGGSPDSADKQRRIDARTDSPTMRLVKAAEPVSPGAVRFRDATTGPTRLAAALPPTGTEN